VSHSCATAEKKPERVYETCLAAGRQALANYAYNEALRFLKYAEAAHQAAGLKPEPGFLHALGEANFRSNQLEEAIAYFAKSIDHISDPLERAETDDEIEVVWNRRSPQGI